MTVLSTTKRHGVSSYAHNLAALHRARYNGFPPFQPRPAGKARVAVEIDGATYGVTVPRELVA